MFVDILVFGMRVITNSMDELESDSAMCFGEG